MKIAPVSADLLIKLALGAALLGGVAYLVNRGIKGVGSAVDGLKATFDTIAAAPGKALDSVVESVVETAKEGGATWQAGSKPNDNYSNEGRGSYYHKYDNPLMNDDGYDFGNLSG